MIELVIVIYYVMYILGQFLCVFLIYRYIFSISVVSLNKCYVNGSLEEHF